MNNETDFIAELAQQVNDRIMWNLDTWVEYLSDFNESGEWETIQHEIVFQLRQAYLAGRAMANMEGQSND